MAEPIVEPSANAAGPSAEATESTPAATSTQAAVLAGDRPAPGGPGRARSEGTLREGMVLIRELVGLHPLPFTVAVVGAAIYAGATVGSTVVLGRITDRVIFPAFDTGELPSRALLWGVAADDLGPRPLWAPRRPLDALQQLLAVLASHRLGEHAIGREALEGQRLTTGELHEGGVAEDGGCPLIDLARA